MFWDKSAETMPRAEIEALQLERLRHVVRWCYERSPFYRERLDACGVGDGSRIRVLGDIEHIPFTTKDDIRDHYPFGLMCTPMKQIVRLHASSGTTGKPIVAGYTKADLELWSDLIARLAVMAGCTDEDIVQITFTYGLFTGGFGLHYGLEKLGATIVPISSGNTDRQLMLMQDFGTTVLVATPTYAVYLAEAVKEKGIPREALKLRVGLFGSESHTPEMRHIIEETLGLFATDNYGLTELMGPGVAGECRERNGLHLAEDHFIAEIIDPDTGARRGEGEQGELVITSLTREAFPILRYRTKDITRLETGACPCGRTHARVAKLTGRTDDMIIIKGVNVFPSQVESVLMGMEHIGPHYQLVAKREKYVDSLEVHVELVDGSLLESYGELEKLRAKIHDRLKSVLGLECKVMLVEPKTIERFVGKAKRVVDLRNK